MPIYEIEQYEVYAQTYRVRDASPAEAVKRLLNGEATPLDNSLDLIEVCHTMGLPVAEHAGIAAELRRLQVPIPGTVIPSIRSIVTVVDE